MLQNQEVAVGLTHLADSLCEKCPMSEACGDAPVCGDVRLLKQAVALLSNND
ncbi:hypothetical protein [Sporomusa malonica]|uniref:Uncharacterized protein n=1 Tax=Sporomusa malonica TaxID=112901 RepID=A0A1W2CST6_9FIRM|nr:hypothetical protein [Sporomusa malonica]SMC88300.1 hypothetical protein SAMN04488500_111132 [Sporomusa malonica]